MYMLIFALLQGDMALHTHLQLPNNFFKMYWGINISIYPDTLMTSQGSDTVTSIIKCDGSNTITT